MLFRLSFLDYLVLHPKTYKVSFPATHEVNSIIVSPREGSSLKRRCSAAPQQAAALYKDVEDHHKFQQSDLTSNGFVACQFVSPALPWRCFVSAIPVVLAAAAYWERLRMR